MSNQDNQNNIISFLRCNQPVPPCPSSDLEQRIMDSLEPRTIKDCKLYKTLTWTVPSAIATGFLFTTVSFGVRTPRIALEPNDLEIFLVNNWQDTLSTHSATFASDDSSNWLLPRVAEPQQTLSVSAQ